MRQSLVTSLTSVYKQLHFGQMYLQFHQSLSSKREPKSLKSLQIVNLLIGLMTIGAVMHLSIESESYLNYLNSNQYLLNLRSQLGSPIFNAQGSSASFRSNMRALDAHSITPEEYKVRSQYILYQYRDSAIKLQRALQTSFRNPIVAEIYHRPILMYKSMMSLTEVQPVNTTYYYLIVEMFRSIITYELGMQKGSMPETKSQAATFRISNTLKF